MVTTGKEDDRHGRWQSFFKAVDFEQHPDASKLSKLDDSASYDFFDGVKATEFYTCAYYRFHAELGDRSYADAIDTEIFGEPLRKSGVQVFALAPDHRIFLPDPLGADVHSFAYDGEHKIPILGRDKERETLERFLGDDDGFLWLQIAGVAGQGKSRLAWELIERARGGMLDDERFWQAGFWAIPRAESGDPAYTKFVDHWENWKPKAPHLLVVDYAVAAGPALATAIQAFMDRCDSFEHPVRLILLERQRWDRGGLFEEPQGTDEMTGFRAYVQSQNRAAWFETLNTAAEHRDFTDPSHWFEFDQSNGVVELTELSTEHLVKITRDVFARFYPNESPKLSDHEIASLLKRLDGEGRPLYPYFLGQVLADSSFDIGWTRDDLLNAVVTRDQQKRWSKIYPGKAPTFMSDDPAMICAALATMSGGLNYDQLLNLPDVDMNEELLRKVLILVNAPYEATVSGPAEFAPPLLPDLLGEWFALKVLERKKQADQVDLIHQAWSISAVDMGFFMVRVALDFPFSSGFKSILKVAPSALESQHFFVQAILATHLELIGAYGYAKELGLAYDIYGYVVRFALEADRPEIWAEQAKGAVNLINVYNHNGDFLSALNTYSDIVSLANKAYLPEIRGTQSKAAYNILIYCGRAGMTDLASALHDDIFEIAREFNKPEFREIQARASIQLINSYGHTGQLTNALDLYSKRSEQLHGIDKPTFRESLAHTLANLIISFSQSARVEVALGLYKELANMASSSDQAELRELQAKASVSVILELCQKKHITSAHRLYETIVWLSRDFNQPALRDERLKSAVNLISACMNASEYDLAQKLYSDCVGFVSKFDQPFLREMLMTASTNMVGCYCDASKHAEAYAIYEVIVGLARQFDEPNLLNKQVETAFCLFNAYLRDGKIETALVLYEDMDALTYDLKDPIIFRYQFAAQFSLIRFWVMCGKIADARDSFDNFIIKFRPDLIVDGYINDPNDSQEMILIHIKNENIDFAFECFERMMFQ